MKRKDIYKHIKGYMAGFTVFIILLPALIYGVSRIAVNITVFDSTNIRNFISIFFFTPGLIFAVWSNIDLFRIGQGGPADLFNIDISPRTKRLVVNGPYRYTRNPMVFGMNSIYLSFSIYLNSLPALIFVIIFLLLVIAYLKLTEEKRLLRDFGEEYLEYKRNVPMIIPFLPTRK